MLLDHAKFAPTALRVLVFLITAVVLHPDPLRGRLYFHGQGFAERFDLERPGLIVFGGIEDVRTECILKVEEFELGLFLVLNLGVLLVIIVMATVPRGLPRRFLLRVDHGDADQVKWLLCRISFFAQELACVEGQLVFAECSALRLLLL